MDFSSCHNAIPPNCHGVLTDEHSNSKRHDASSSSLDCSFRQLSNNPLIIKTGYLNCPKPHPFFRATTHLHAISGTSLCTHWHSLGKLKKWDTVDEVYRATIPVAPSRKVPVFDGDIPIPPPPPPAPHLKMRHQVEGRKLFTCTQLLSMFHAPC